MSSRAEGASSPYKHNMHFTTGTEGHRLIKYVAYQDDHGPTWFGGRLLEEEKPDESGTATLWTFGTMRRGHLSHPDERVKAITEKEYRRLRVQERQFWEWYRVKLDQLKGSYHLTPGQKRYHAICYAHKMVQVAGH